MRAVLCCALFAALASAQTLTTVASFRGTSANPYSLIQGSDGNFYGSTLDGVVFKLTPAGVESMLYESANLQVEDLNPIIQGRDGNFYGTTQVGGNGNCDSIGCGTIFLLTPGGALTTTYNFQGSDGFFPLGNLIQGSDGNFYGTTAQGGTGFNSNSNGEGAIFRITPAGVFSLLASFTGMNGSYPAAMIQGSDGNFYGITQYGGSGSCPGMYLTYTGCGSIFKFTSGGALSTLYSFPAATNSTSNIFPQTLVQASDGNFYGTTPYGGTGSCSGEGQPSGCGVVFKITPGGVFSVLHNFAPADGSVPSALIQASDGNFYGVAQFGGANNCPAQSGVSPSGCGTLFKITPSGSFTTLHSFGATAADGQNPQSLLQAADGNLYGAASAGGADQSGAVFEYQLSSSGPLITAVVNGASFQPGIAPGSWMTVTGTNLSSVTDTWNNAIVNGALPAELDGVKVMVAGEPAYIEYISSTQINAIVPSVPAGTAAVTVINSSGASPVVNAQVGAVAPAFFLWGNYAVATRQDFTYAVKNGVIPGLTTTPAAPGDVIILWGTGFGPTSPADPAGMETPSNTTYNTASAVSVTIGSTSATVYGAALAPGFAGLYQVAIQIPASLASGDYPVVAAINNVASPSTTMITVEQ